MDFFGRLVIKYTIFFQSYRISCLVQSLRIRFLGFIKCCISLLNLYSLVLYTLFTLPCPPRFPPRLHRPPVFLPVYTPTHLPASLPLPPQKTLGFGGGGSMTPSFYAPSPVYPSSINPAPHLSLTSPPLNLPQ